MAISNMTGWSGVTPAATPIPDVTYTPDPNPSPALTGLLLSGSFIQNEKNYIGFIIQIAAGYRATGVEISTTSPNTIIVNVVADSLHVAYYIGDRVETSENYQQNVFELNFEIVESGQDRKTYTFRKIAKGQGFPTGRTEVGPQHS